MHWFVPESDKTALFVAFLTGGFFTFVEMFTSSSESELRITGFGLFLAFVIVSLEDSLLVVVVFDVFAPKKFRMSLKINWNYDIPPVESTNFLDKLTIVSPPTIWQKNLFKKSKNYFTNIDKYWQINRETAKLKFLFTFVIGRQFDWIGQKLVKIAKLQRIITRINSGNSDFLLQSRIRIKTNKFWTWEIIIECSW